MFAALASGKVVPYDCADNACPTYLGEFGILWGAVFVVLMLTILNLVRRGSPFRVVGSAWLFAISIGALFFATDRFYDEDVVVGGIATAVMIITSVLFVVKLPAPAPAAPRRKRQETRPSPKASRPAAAPRMLGRRIEAARSRFNPPRRYFIESRPR